MTRRRWVYTHGGAPLQEPVEVGAEWRNVALSTGDLGKFEYDNCRTTDGVDISSRSKLNRYLKETGLALASDFKGVWAKAREQRAAEARGEVPEARVREIQDTVGRTAYELRSKRGRR